MNARISKTWDILIGQVVDANYNTNLLNVNATLFTNTQDWRTTNLAYDRMCYWMEQCLYDAVVIQQDDATLDAHMATGRHVLELPCSPIDSTLGIMIFRKLSSIVNNQFIITDVDVSSSRGDGVIYHHNLDENTSLLVEPGWWNDPGPAFANQTKKMPKKTDTKIISIDKSLDWKDLGLAMDDKEESSSTVLFGRFPRDTKE